MKELSVENLRFGYSAIPNGVNMIWYSSDTYDSTSPRIYNDAADCGGILWLRPYIEVPSENTPEALLKHRLHVQPLVQYGLEGSRPIHCCSPSYSSLFQGGDRHTRAVIYLKPDSMLVYLVNDGPRRSAASFSVNVLKKWRRCLVLNTVTMQWTIETTAGGRLAAADVDCCGGPVAVVIRPCPRKPAIVWRDAVCRDAALAVDGNRLQVSAHGVAHACGACYVYLPKGKALHRGARPLPFVAEHVCLVPLAFDACGRSESDAEITNPLRRA